VAGGSNPLTHAHRVLTAYECGDSLKGSQRDLAFSVMHLVQMVQTLVDKSLDNLPLRD